MVGFTWYSLTDQVDWNTALRENNDRLTPVGLCDLDRKIRPVGAAYKQFIADWSQVLPAQDVCPQVLIVMLQISNEARARQQKQEARTATVVRRALESARLVLVGRDEQKLTKAAAAVAAAPAPAPGVWAAACDVGNEAVVEATVAEALKRFSRPDVVVNNAGLIEFKPLKELTGTV